MAKNESCFYKFPQKFLFAGVSLVQTSSNNNNSYKAHVSQLVSRSLKSPGPFNNVCRNWLVKSDQSKSKIDINYLY